MTKDDVQSTLKTPSLTRNIELHTFVLRSGPQEIADDRQRRILTDEILPSYIMARRWFQNKNQTIEQIDYALLGPRLGGSDDVMYGELKLHINGRLECYALPLAVAWEDEPTHPLEAPLALARVRRGRRVGLLTDAFAAPRFATAILDGLREQTTTALNGGGTLRFQPTAALDKLSLPETLDFEWLGAEQSNSSMIIGRQAVVKLLRRLTTGQHPEAEMSRVLTDRGFEGVPALLGDLVRVAEDGNVATVAIVQSFIQNQGDGWAWTLQRLGQIVDDSTTPVGDPHAGQFDNYRGFAEILGRRIGQMHAVLGFACDDDDFTPERATARQADALGKTVAAQIGKALDSLPEQTYDALTAHRDALIGLANSLATAAEGALLIRIHGDLHLGQVLVAGGDVAIIDFEGEPLKPLAERRAKANPMRDVAGMLRSFDYAAAAVERDSRLTEESGSLDRARLALAQFREAAREAFLAGYAQGVGTPLDAQSLRLLELFLLEKAAYEISYEAANRPGWLDVPIRGLVDLFNALMARHGKAD